MAVINNMKDSMKLPLEVREALLNNDVNELQKLRLLKGSVYGKKGKTLLHYASKYCTSPKVPIFCVQILKVSAKAMMKRGKASALHVSCKYGRLETAMFLVSVSESCLALSDIQGETPLGLAAKHNHTDLAIMLHRKGGKLQSKNKEFWTPLHWAAKNGNSLLVNYLISESADPNVRTNLYENSLQLAAESGSIETVKILLEFVSDLEISKKGTLIHHAYQNPEMIQFLLTNTKWNNYPKLPLLLEIKAPVDLIMRNCTNELTHALILVFRSDREDILEEMCKNYLIQEACILKLEKSLVSGKCKKVVSFWARWQVIKKILFVQKFDEKKNCISRLPNGLIREIVRCL